MTRRLCASASSLRTATGSGTSPRRTFQPCEPISPSVSPAARGGRPLVPRGRGSARRGARSSFMVSGGGNIEYPNQRQQPLAPQVDLEDVHEPVEDLLDQRWIAH